MEATIQGDGQSSLSVTKTGITIRLPSQVFGQGWVNVMAWLREAIGQRRFIHGARAPYRSDEMNHIAGLMIALVMDYVE